jgi:hypothetical protein
MLEKRLSNHGIRVFMHPQDFHLIIAGEMLT